MELCPCMRWVLSKPLPFLLLVVVGVLYLLLHLYISFLHPEHNLCRRYGQWAIVSGATNGIGKGFAFQLARLGLRLVLIGRSPKNLSLTSSSILEKYPGVQIETAMVDLDRDVGAGVAELKERIVSLDIGLLVNNAGCRTRMRGTSTRLTRRCWRTS